MPPPPNLPAALLHHAALGREEPWLFRPEGWDWHWWSWGAAARQMSSWAERLASLPAGSLVSFSYTALPEAVIVDLAIQAAGLVSVPVSGSVEGCGERFDLDPPAPFPLFYRSSEHVVVPDLVAIAERVQAEIGPPSRQGKREIVVLSGPLERPEERAMLSWATVTGAVVVLEPNPAFRAATAAWVRPTVFQGTVAEIAVLRQWVEKEGRGCLRPKRLPFRRLRTVVVIGEEMGAEEKEFWQGREVSIGSLGPPASLPA